LKWLYSVLCVTALLAGSATSAGASSLLPPRDVAARVVEPESLAVRFVRATGEVSNSGSRHRATCSSDSGGVQRTAVRAANPILVEGVTRGAAYRCWVAAVDGDGSGARSALSNRVVVPGPPSPPKRVSAALLSGTYAAVSFAPPTSDGASPIELYTATCRSALGSTVGVGSTSPIEVGPLLAATTYRCVVSATNGYGTSRTSAPSNRIKTLARPTVLQIAGATYAYHWCGLLSSGAVKCWGNNAYGQLGLGDVNNRGDAAGEMGDALPAVDLGTGRTAKAVAVGSNFSCAILDNNNVKCWGGNGGGQLGLAGYGHRGDNAGEMGDNLPVVDLGTGRTVKAIAAGSSYVCAVLDNNAVKCWGANSYGQLGVGDTTDRGPTPGDMGDNLPAVDLGAGRTARSIAAGNAHTCAILDDNALKCWGWNRYGQLGRGDMNHRGDAAGEMGNSLLPVDVGAGRTAVAVGMGWSHTCAVLDNGSVKCWGSNESQLGLGDTVPRGDGEGEMGDSLPAVDLGAVRTAKAISAGSGHTCVLLDNNTVKCWGYNQVGQLGLGDLFDRGDNPGEMGDTLLPVDLGSMRTAVSVSTGSGHNCALLDDRTVKCWGYNDSGQLGLGDTAPRGGSPGQMGDNLPGLPV